MKRIYKVMGIIAVLSIVAILYMAQIGESTVAVPIHEAGTRARMQDKVSNPGAVFWVNSTDGTDADGYGRDPATPYATVDYAINQCTANDNDVIYVLPGHVEDGATNTLFDADVVGISIIGLGNGLDRPEFHYNNAADIVSIGADNVTLKNLVFVPSVTTITVAVDVEANVDNFTIENCEFAVGEAAGTDEFASAIILNSGAHDAVIKGNDFYTAITDAHCAQAINLGVGGAVARTKIVDNLFYGNWSTAAIIDGTTAVTELLIKDNVIKVKDGEPGIELATTSTGNIVNNQIESTGVTCSAAIVGADMAWMNNYCVTADGAAAVPIGLDSLTDTAADIAVVDANVDSLLGNTAIGSEFMISKTFVHTDILTGGTDVTGTATGTLLLKQVVILNGATVMDASGGASNVQLLTDNAQGSAVFAATSDDDIGANESITLDKWDTVLSTGTIITNGKKLKINTSANDQTTDGNMTIYLILQRLSSGATIAAAS